MHGSDSSRHLALSLCPAGPAARQGPLRGRAATEVHGMLGDTFRVMSASSSPSTEERSGSDRVVAAAPWALNCGAVSEPDGRLHGFLDLSAPPGARKAGTRTAVATTVSGGTAETWTSGHRVSALARALSTSDPHSAPRIDESRRPELVRHRPEHRARHTVSAAWESCSAEANGPFRRVGGPSLRLSSTREQGR